MCLYLNVIEVIGHLDQIIFTCPSFNTSIFIIGQIHVPYAFYGSISLYTYKSYDCLVQRFYMKTKFRFKNLRIIFMG